MVQAYLTKEITVETPNTKGTAAKLTQLIANQAKANIRAAWAAGYNSQGHFSLITDNNQKAFEAIRKEFPKAQEQEVLVVNVPNSVGNLADITNKISNAGLNIDYLFTTYVDDKPSIVVCTDDNQKAYQLFNHN